MSGDLNPPQWRAVMDAVQQYIRSNDPTATTSQPIAKLTKPIARYIDHTLLRLDATEEQIDRLCAEALSEKFATVCVRVNHVARARETLKDSSEVGIACVVGFHEGTQPTEAKVEEARKAIEHGATELDMVMNRDLLKERRYGDVYNELAAIRAVARPPVLLKVILETSQLGEYEVIAGCVLANYAGLDFVKTSTGFCGRGATIKDVRLMSAVAEYLCPKNANWEARRMRVKAAGGVRSYEDAVRMVEAGASRIGTSGGMGTVSGEREVLKEDGDGSGDKSVEVNGPTGY